MDGLFAIFGLGLAWLFICACNGVDFLVGEIRGDRARCAAQERWMETASEADESPVEDGVGPRTC